MPACVHACITECTAIVAFPTEDYLPWLILLLSHVQLIHMDLKSKNVLLNARKDLAKIADVGLSRIIQSTLGGAGSTPFGVGTFEYTAPEILLGRQCNEKVHPAHQHSLSVFLINNMVGTHTTACTEPSA